jgi:hypothetical protein
MTTINNADVLRLVTVNAAQVDGFNHAVNQGKPGHWSKKWPAAAGDVPSPEMMQVALLMGKQRKPGPEAGFVAMQLRSNGASLAELAAAFNSGPAHNHSRALSSDAKGNGLHYFERSKGGGRFMLTFTIKGQKALEAALKAMATPVEAPTVATDKPVEKPVKGKGKGKKPTSDAVKALPAPSVSQAIDTLVETLQGDVDAVQAEIAAQQVETHA